MNDRIRTVGLTLALAVVYLGAARAGLTMATIGQSVTLVWPPTGIALAALFVLGRRHWPGVALGAFLANVVTPGVPALSALGIAAGNTLEALVGAALLKAGGVERDLGRVRDVLVLVGGGALVGTLCSATIGVASLWLGGVVESADVLVAWGEWWAGDALGAMVVAPALLTWSTRSALRTPRTRVEAAVSTVVTAGGAWLIFGGISELRPIMEPLPYMVFPGLIWMSLRFGPCGGSAGTLGIAVLAVLATVAGRGPLVGSSLTASLVRLDVFLAVISLTAMVLGAFAAERQRALYLRDEFIALASHELRTPLTPLKLHLQMLRRTSTDPQLSRRLDAAEHQLHRITRLVEELLDTSRIASGRWSLRPEQVDLGQLAREVVASLKAELEAVHCTAEVRASGMLVGQWDPNRLHQVIANLLTNAMKFGAGKPIVISIRDLGDQVELSVADQGVGIHPGEQRRIFEPFERTAAARGVAGLGLGLYVVRAMVEAHGGTVTVRSVPSYGATFIVQLPRSARPSQSLTAVDAPALRGRA